MTRLTQPLHDHHKHCDNLFAEAEEAAHKKRWPQCLESFRRFRGELEAHFSTEEQVLFPAFETASGMVAGPSQVMRFEHAQMRDLLGQIEQAATQQNLDQFSGSAETLLVLMQHILYPMCEQSLSGQGLSLVEPLKARVEAACPA